MTRCPSQDWDRYIAGEEARAEAEEEGRRMEVIDKLMLRKWNQATGCYHKDWADAARCFYKYTDCGPYLHARPGHLVVGSIVEGVDMAPPDEVLGWPFTVADVRRAIKNIEEGADEIWRDTHGCDDCGPENETGYRSINPGCKTCEGSGTIF